MTARKGRSKAQKHQTSAITDHHKVKAAAARAEKLPTSTLRGRMNMEKTGEIISNLRRKVESQAADLKIAQKQLHLKTEALKSLAAKLDSSEEQVTRLKQTLRVDRRRYQRAVASKLTLQERVRMLKADIMPNSQKEVDRLTLLLQQAYSKIDEAHAEVSHTHAQVDSLRADKAYLQRLCTELEQKLTVALERALGDADRMSEKLCEAKTNLSQARKKVRKLKSEKNAQYELAKAYKKQAEALKTYKAMCKGVYTDNIRELAAFIKQSGCSDDLVGEVIECVFNVAGISVQGRRMSGRTVGCIITENGIASQIQLGYEMAVAPNLTIAGD